MRRDDRTKLRSVCRHLGDTMRYEYDFGDSWEHDILLEGMFLAEEGVDYPRCIGGARACPPEDCGGIHGYYRLMEERDPEHELHERYLEWVGEEYDPEAFSAEKVNAILQRIKRPATS